jgi:hypothetical protein
MAMTGRISFAATDVISGEWKDCNDGFERMDIRVVAGNSEVIITISRMKKKPEVIRLVPGEDPF